MNNGSQLKIQPFGDVPFCLDYAYAIRGEPGLGGTVATKRPSNQEGFQMVSVFKWQNKWQK